jgi:VWFA-related protein
MRRNALRSRRWLLLAVAFVLAFGSVGAFGVLGQSRRQPPQSDQKKNQRPDPNAQKQEEPTPADVVGKPQEAEKITVATNLVNVDAVVYQKKTGQIVTGLHRNNFAIFVDGVKKDISNFSTPEAPITITLVVEYSKWTEMFGAYASNGMEPGQYEVIRPTAMFLSQFIKPTDYVSVIAFDMRPTPITDFTNNPRRIQEVINLLLRNQPAFRENNLFDALKLTLVGGRADSVVLEDSKAEKADYAGMVAVPDTRRRAVLLVASGIDTFSKINYGEARKIVQGAGIPIYIIGTGNLFFKKYEDRLGATDSITGMPGRMTFLQAANQLQTFAKESGGAYYPITFEGELPSALGSINAMLRNQYSLGFNPGEIRDGKQHKIVVKVDVEGNGQFDDKNYTVNARQYYTAPKPEGAASSSGRQ